jgi:hypothetical protein
MSGKLFQISSPATENDWSPIVTSRYDKQFAVGRSKSLSGVDLNCSV